MADCYDPHEPWDPPQEYVSLYDEGYKGKEPLDDNYGRDDYLTDRQLLRMRAVYAGEVTMMDRWLGKFIERAHELGVMEKTLLIVVSDHGHLLGEHGYTGKLAYALYPEMTDTVFMVRHPQGEGAGKSSDFYASTHDVAPTILGFLGVDQPAPMDGQNLAPLLEGKEPLATERPHHPGLQELRLLQGRTQGDVLPHRHDRRPPLRRRKRRGPEKRPGREPSPRP